MLKKCSASDWKKTLRERPSEFAFTEWKTEQNLSEFRLLEALKEELGMLSIDFQRKGDDEHHE
tara:strand:+ start:1251 stop:1439 length:189 start_codon:yes stop_codon:yes gene_type:complete